MASASMRMSSMSRAVPFSVSVWAGGAVQIVRRCADDPVRDFRALGLRGTGAGWTSVQPVVTAGRPRSSRASSSASSGSPGRVERPSFRYVAGVPDGPDVVRLACLSPSLHVRGTLLVFGTVVEVAVVGPGRRAHLGEACSAEPFGGRGGFSQRQQGRWFAAAGALASAMRGVFLVRSLAAGGGAVSIRTGCGPVVQSWWRYPVMPLAQLEHWLYTAYFGLPHAHSSIGQSGETCPRWSMYPSAMAQPVQRANAGFLPSPQLGQGSSPGSTFVSRTPLATAQGLQWLVVASLLRPHWHLVEP